MVFSYDMVYDIIQNYRWIDTRTCYTNDCHRCGLVRVKGGGSDGEVVLLC